MGASIDAMVARLKPMLTSLVVVAVLGPQYLRCRSQPIGERNTGATLATARLTFAVRYRIERALFGDLAANEQRVEAVRTQIGRLQLGPRNSWELEVTAPTDRCGISECEHWLFDSATGASLLDDAVGTGFDVLDTRHHGWRDLAVSGYISDCEDVTVYYHFDGRKYRLARREEDKSACDQ
jgi:hypothetical protein